MKNEQNLKKHARILVILLGVLVFVFTLMLFSQWSNPASAHVNYQAADTPTATATVPVTSTETSTPTVTLTLPKRTLHSHLPIPQRQLHHHRHTPTYTYQYRNADLTITGTLQQQLGQSFRNSIFMVISQAR
jgi:ABC-type nickel/cobalt efflux system permease component RcnA